MDLLEQVDLQDLLEQVDLVELQVHQEQVDHQELQDLAESVILFLAGTGEPAGK